MKPSESFWAVKAFSILAFIFLVLSGLTHLTGSIIDMNPLVIASRFPEIRSVEPMVHFCEHVACVFVGICVLCFFIVLSVGSGSNKQEENQ